tara:strand:- start:423 stop:845 length:423 start_codon:yes stop_codon:yes gene_type:complete
MPRQEFFSCVNANIDNITTKKINVTNLSVNHPYSLILAHTESLPEEGEKLSTKAFIPFDVKLTALSLQVNQDLVCDSKVKVMIDNNEFIFTLSPSKSTVFTDSSLVLKKNSLVAVTIENMKDDEGDISTCTLLLHGFVNA